MQIILTEEEVIAAVTDYINNKVVSALKPKAIKKITMRRKASRDETLGSIMVEVQDTKRKGVST